RPVRLPARDADGVVRSGRETDGGAVGGVAAGPVAVAPEARGAGASGRLSELETPLVSLLIHGGQRAAPVCSPTGVRRDSPGAYAVVTLGLGWVVGQRLTSYWSFRQKHREIDLSVAQDFHRLYGEFFAVWKLWNYYIRDVGGSNLPGAS